jgi:hypothetical protein
MELNSSRRLRCMFTDRELQVTVILGIITYILYRNIHHINVWRLTPPHVPRQFFINFEPGSLIAIIGSCLAGPIAGMVFGLVSYNPIIRPEVLLIVNGAKFVAIGYLHRKIQPPYNILAIPLGILITIPVHPTLVHYIMYRQVFVHLYWYQNLVFQTVVVFGTYLVLRLVSPQMFTWINPSIDYRLKIPYLFKKTDK